MQYDLAQKIDYLYREAKTKTIYFFILLWASPFIIPEFPLSHFRLLHSCPFLVGRRDVTPLLSFVRSPSISEFFLLFGGESIS